MASICPHVQAESFQPLVIGWVDGERQLQLRGFGQGSELYLSLADLAEAAGMTQEVDYSVLQMTLSLGPDRVVLYLDNPFVSLNNKIWNLGDPVRFIQGDWAIPTRLVTTILPGVLGKKISWSEPEQRFRLEEERPAPRPGPPKNWRERGEHIQTVVVDAGHGGIDPGAVGRGGLQEKTLNLDMALRLKTLLESRLGVEVILTRQDDTFIPLHRRTEIANEYGADLFVSIHCNAAPRRRGANGSETYFLSLAKNDEARATAAMENAATRYEGKDTTVVPSDEVNFILWDLAQNVFLKESGELAELVQREMGRHLPVLNRGVNQAGFYVLNGAFMPAILVETAYISNPDEARLLKTDSFRQRAAEAICAGVEEFKRRFEGRK